MRSPEALVVDASVAVKWYLRDEEFVAQADDLRNRIRDGLLVATAPHLSRHEVASAVAVACRLGRLTREQVEHDLENYLQSGLSIDADPDWVLTESVRKTMDLPISFYDAVYLAFAEGLGIPFLTADRRLHDAVRERVPYIRWIGDVGGAE